MNDALLVFGCNGVLGRTICESFSKRFFIVGVDVQESAVSNDIGRYVRYTSLASLEMIYQTHKYYAVLHLQQFKAEGFVGHDLLSIGEEDYDQVMAANLKTVFFSSQKYINSVSGSAGEIKGRIINFTSTYSIISSSPSLYEGTEMGNPPHYTVSKAGLYGLTKYLAAYFKNYGVICNSVSPHGVANNQSEEFHRSFGKRSPLGRLSQPTEVAPAVRLLLDPNNSYMNGVDLKVDGGWSAC